MVSLEDVGSGENAPHLGRLEPGGERIGGVGAGVDVGLAFDPEEASVRRRVTGNDVVVLAAVRVAGELLAAVLDPANGMTATHREPAEKHFLGEQDPLVAEAAPHVRRDHADAALRDPEALREAVPHDVRHLAGGPDDQHVLAPVPPRDHRPPLEGRHALPGGAEGAGDGNRGLVPDRPEVRPGHRFEEHVVAPLVVKERRRRVPSLPRVVDGRQLLEVEPHRLREVLGGGPVVPNAGGEDLPHVPHPLRREDRLARALEPGEGGGGEDGGNPLEVRGREHVRLAPGRLAHPAHPGVGERAPHERHVAGAGKPEVGDELALAVEVPRVLVARDTRPDAACRRRHRRLAHRIPASSIEPALCRLAAWADTIRKGARSRGKDGANGPVGRRPPCTMRRFFLSRRAARQTGVESRPGQRTARHRFETEVEEWIRAR